MPDARWPGLPDSVTVHSATNREGRRVHVLHNWSWDGVGVNLPGSLTDLLTEEAAVVDRLDLGAWDVRVLGE